MKRMTAFSVLMVAVLMVGCGGDTHESLIDEGISMTKEFVSILGTVKDEASADAAAAKIDALSAKSEGLSSRMKALGEPDEAQKTALLKKMGEVMAPMMESMTKAAELSSKPEVMKSEKLKAAIAKFQKAMK